MRFLLDEHLSPLVAARLRSLGHDAVAAAERPDLAGLDDRQLLGLAATEGRALVTMDVRDLTLLAVNMAAGGTRHAGVVLVSPRRFPPTRDGSGRLAAALDRLTEARATDDLADEVVWLATE